MLCAMAGYARQFLPVHKSFKKKAATGRAGMLEGLDTWGSLHHGLQCTNARVRDVVVCASSSNAAHEQDDKILPTTMTMTCRWASERRETSAAPRRPHSLHIRDRRAQPRSTVSPPGLHEPRRRGWGRKLRPSPPMPGRKLNKTTGTVHRLPTQPSANGSAGGSLHELGWYPKGAGRLVRLLGAASRRYRH